MGDRVLLRDHAAHRDPEQVKAVEADPVDQRGEIVGHLLRGVRAGGRGGLPDAAVVVAHDAVALGERRELGLPRLLRVGEPVDEHERLRPVPVDLVRQVQSVCGDGRHALLDVVAAGFRLSIAGDRSRAPNRIEPGWPPAAPRTGRRATGYRARNRVTRSSSGGCVENIRGMRSVSVEGVDRVQRLGRRRPDERDEVGRLIEAEQCLGKVTRVGQRGGDAIGLELALR